MSKAVLLDHMPVTHFECKDCGQVSDKELTMRPNGKFCNRDCMRFVKTQIAQLRTGDPR
jgi:hypothetical protein